MSMIAIMPRADGILMAGDGVASKDNGEVFGYVSKLRALPDLGVVYGATGLGMMNQCIDTYLPRQVRNFDEFCEVLPELFEAICRDMIENGRVASTDHRSSVMCGGWSDRDEAFRAYRIFSYAKESQINAEGDMIVLDPWTLHDIPQGHTCASSAPDEKHTKSFRVFEEGLSDDECLTRMICAARASSGAREEGAHFNAGGFVELAMLQRNMASMWIAHRWPEDVIGEPVDPSRGEPLPPALQGADETR